MESLHKIMKHINKLRYDDDIIDYLESYNINDIFNKSEEQIQIDFIKYLLSKMKKDFII